MSRFYKMGFTITGYNKEKEIDIIEAISLIWDIDTDNCYIDSSNQRAVDIINNKNNLNLPCTYCFVDGEGNLCGGESEDEFAERASLLIWETNGGFCGVMITATYLEDSPYEQYEYRDHDKYIEMMKREKDKKK